MGYFAENSESGSPVKGDLPSVAHGGSLVARSLPAKRSSFFLRQHQVNRV
jgi:hypothetical protein